MDEKLVAIVVPDEKKARQCADALQDLNLNTSLTVYATAIVQRDGDNARVIEHGPPGHVGVMLGSVLGLVIGALGGPVGMIAGAASGGLVGGVAHAAVSEDFMEDVTARLRSGEFVVFAEVLEEWESPLDERVAQLGGTIIREMRRGYVEELFEHRVASDKKRLEGLSTHYASVKTRHMAADLEREIQRTEKKLRDQAEKAKQHIERAQQELDSKLHALDEQAGDANPQIKKHIERRTRHLREDFEKRVKKLRSAYDLTQDALNASTR